MDRFALSLLAVCCTTLQEIDSARWMICYCGEVDNEIAAAPVDILDDTNLIRNVQVMTEWNNFRDQLANDMFADYQARLG